MKIFRRITWQTLWRNPVRTWVTVIGIVLSAAMFMAVCTMGISLWDFLLRGTVMDVGDYFVRYDYMNRGELDSLSQDERVDRLFDSQALGYFRRDSEDSDWMALGVISAVEKEYFSQIGIGLIQGRFPENSSEIVIPNELIYNINNYGISLGDTITLDVHSRFPEDVEGLRQSQEDSVTQRSFTVVGFSSGTQSRIFSDAMDCPSFFTLADGSQGAALWHRGFVQCSAWDAQALAQEAYGPRCVLNQSLLDFYGVTGYTNINTVIAAFATALCCIIMAGSVSLIYNAFSISVSQRTQQFGLLCSIGATRRQLRGMVFTEGLYLCLLGIPVGLACGYGGIAVTLALLRPRLDEFLSLNAGAITLQVVFSPVALVAAGTVAFLTVMVSAAIPAARATRVSPMACIRQTNVYQQTKKPIRTGWLTRKLFGLPGALAKKYYHVSRSKYRATVISLSISVLLFLSATGFAQSLQASIASTVGRENYDIDCYSLEDKQALREQDFVSYSAFLTSDIGLTWMPEENYSPEALALAKEKNIYDSRSSIHLPQADVYYLEDAVFRAYLEAQGIDPEPYFADGLLALNVQKVRTLYRQTEEGIERYTLSYDPLAEGVQALEFFSNQIPDLVAQYQPEGYQHGIGYKDVDGEGNAILVLQYFNEDIQQAHEVIFSIQRETDSQGAPVLAYYHRETGECVAREAAIFPEIAIGATVKELPFGIPSSAQRNPYITLILPLCRATEQNTLPVSLALNVSDHAAAVKWLDERDARYADFLAEEETNRTMLLVIQVFSYGFIVLISLISASNVFNTVSTNITLRRRDFGTLKSVGMTSGGMRRMLALECLIYGAKALLYGMPMGIGVCWLIYSQTAHRTGSEGFVPPWAAMMIAAVSVFAVVFASMFYASRRLNQTDPIQAIREENI